jgi:hypothetical protein
VCKVHPGIQTFADKGVVCKLFAVIKGQGAASVFMWPEQINDRLTHQARLLGIDLRGKGIAGLPVYQGHDGSLVALANHGVALYVADTAFLIDYLGALLNAHTAFDAAAPLAATAVALSARLLAAQVLGQIALGLLVSQNALVDGLAADAKALFEHHPVGDLLG